MDKVGLDYDFEHLTPALFRTFLQELQEKGPYKWPNLYFAWEKADGSLLMVGTNSTQSFHMIVHECDPHSWLNKTHAVYGEPMEYSSVLYCINPRFGYMEHGKPFDPVERLVEKVSVCKYLGFWRDMDVLMEQPHSFSKTLACGRWELAKEKIGVGEKQASIDDVLVDAEARADFKMGYGDYERFVSDSDLIQG